MREFSLSAIIFLLAGIRDRTEDIADNIVGLGVIRGTRRLSSVQSVASALCYSGKDNRGGRIGNSYAGVIGIFQMTLLNKVS
jgi:hypothetical protein